MSRAHHKVWLIAAATGCAALWFAGAAGAHEAGGGGAAEKLAAEVAGLEKSYREMAPSEDHVAAMALLGRAIAMQKRLVQLEAPGDIEAAERLERLIVARDNERAQWAAGQLDALEDAAEAAAKAGHPDDRLQKLREAARLQREVDDSKAEDRCKDYAREMRLAQAVAEAEAEPLVQQLGTALQAARGASARKQWADAAASYRTARALRLQLGRDYGRTRFAEAGALAELDEEITAFAPVEPAAGVDDLEKRADAAAAASHVDEAATLYAAARDGQIQLNGNFAGSRFASPERVEELEIKRQTVLAAEMLKAARALDEAVTGHLRQREAYAAERDATKAAALLDRVEKDFPKSRNFEGELKIKLDYLSARGADLRAIQDVVYDELRPLPGFNDRLMLRAEVPQVLYAKVMSTNPSRTAGGARPVDSVSWFDAQEFCRRLSWVLGTPVHLPTELEFFAAGESGAAGFTGLNDQVREWLQPTRADGPSAPVVGNDRADSAPSPTMGKQQRARDLSFRIVVRYALE